MHLTISEASAHISDRSFKRERPPAPLTQLGEPQNPFGTRFRFRENQAMASSPYENWVSNPAEDNGPLMSICFWSLTAVSLTFLIVRLCIRQHQGKIWIDGLLLTLSWVCSLSSSWRSSAKSTKFALLAQAVVNQLAINLGFGKHVLDSKSLNEDDSPVRSDIFPSQLRQ